MATSKIFVHRRIDQDVTVTGRLTQEDDGVALRITENAVIYADTPADIVRDLLQLAQTVARQAGLPVPEQPPF